MTTRDDLHRGTTRGAGWLGLGAATVKGSQTVVLLILAALLEPSAMGVLALGALVLNVTSAITDLGTGTALVHWRDDVERAARTALTLSLVLGLALTAAVWVIAPWFADALGAGDVGADVLRGLILCLPFISASAVGHELLRRAFAFRRRVMPDIVGALVGAAVSVVLAVQGAGVYALVVGQLVQAVLALALLWAVAPSVRPGWSRSDAAGLLSYGGHLAGGNIVSLLMLNVDYVLVARLLGVTALGVYSMSFRLAYMPVVLIAVVVCGAAFAYLCRLEGDEVGRATDDVLVMLLGLVLPLYVGMLMLAPQLGLLGDQWTPGVPVLRWLAVYGVLVSLVQLAVIVLNAVGRTRTGLLVNLFHLALLAVLLLMMTPLGVTAVGIAQSLAAALTLAVAVVAVQRHVTGFDPRDVLRRTAPMAAGVAAMVVVGELAIVLLPWARVSVTGLLLVGTALLLAYVAPSALLARRRGAPLLQVLGVRA